MRSPNRRHNLSFLYKYCSAAVAPVILRTQSLRWSSPELFNDPLDVPRAWDGFSYAELEQAYVDRFAVYIGGGATPKSAAAKALLQARTERPTDPDKFFDEMRFFLRLMKPKLEKHMEEMRSAWREKIPRLRILCLSEDPSSWPMWAHYADEHKGVVLELETSDERDSPWLLAEPVRYQTERPRLPAPSEWARAFMGEIDLDWDHFLAEYYLVKHADWSYEREYRVVSGRKPFEAGLFGDYAFHPKDLRTVILGARVEADTEASICALIGANYPDTRVQRAELDLAHRRIARVAA